MTERDVLIVSPYRHAGEPLTEPSGSSLNRHTHDFADALAQRCNVGIIGPRRAGAKPWRDREFAVIPSYTPGHPLNFAQIAGAVRQHRSPRAIVHVQHELFAYGGLATAFALPLAMRSIRQAGHRVVTTVHGVIPLDRIDRKFVRSNAIGAPPRLVRRAWRTLITSVCAQSDVVHVHEAEHAAWLRRHYAVRSRIEVFPVGVGTVPNQCDAAKARTDFGIRPDARVVLFFGNLLERKGIVPFLESVPALLEHDPKLVVLIGGSVPERVLSAFDVTKTLAQLAQHPRVVYVGFVPDERVGALFRAADVLILPYTISISASGPLVLAAGHGLPMLLSNVFAESYPQAPLLFEPSVGGICAAVQTFFSDGDARARCTTYVGSLAARRSWTCVAQRMYGVYEDLRAEARF